jgi:hypothetical protein
LARRQFTKAAATGVLLRRGLVMRMAGNLHMMIDARLEKLTLSFALGLPCAASVALMIWAPGRLAPATYAVLLTLVLGAAAVAFNTWRSAQATGSVGQLIYETNNGRRIEASKSWGLMVSVIAASAATTALLVTTWLS